jgi:SAM-dependent methyltransferase
MSTTDQPDARARLLAHFSTTAPSEQGSKWDDLYKENFLPWDKGFPSPALVDLLTERQDLLPKPQPGRKLRALVPGCGKGYDVLLLSAFGFDACGLDTSERALEAARKEEREKDGKGVYETREGTEKGRVEWLRGDFFREGFGEGFMGTFDFIYDYTVCLVSIYCNEPAD